MAKGIKNRGTQIHPDKRAGLLQRTIIEDDRADARAGAGQRNSASSENSPEDHFIGNETIDLDELAERVLREDIRRAEAFALAVAGRQVDK